MFTELRQLSWRERFGGAEAARTAAAPEAPERRERAAPGLAALFASLKSDGRHSILDFGPADGARLTLLSRYARRVRFAGLLPRPPRGDDLTADLQRISGDAPFDVVLVWDLLDRLDQDERAEVAAQIVAVTRPGARLYAVVDSSGAQTSQPVRIHLLGTDRVGEEPAGSPEPAHSQLLPRHVERLLDPFEVVTGVSLRQGLREYVAQRP